MAKLKFDVNPSIQRLDLVVKGLVNTNSIGNYASAFKGQGLEFAGYRNYTENDDSSKIDWKATSRVGRPLIKEFVEERNLKVYFVVDVSSKMMLGSTEKLKCEYAAEFVASFANTILRSGDEVGLMLFSDGVIKEVVPSTGMKHYYAISDVLSELSYYGGYSNIKGALSHILKVAHEGSLIIFISDFIGEEDFKQELQFAANKFTFIGVLLRDPTDMILPPGMGQLVVQDPSTGQRLVVSPQEMKDYYDYEAQKQVRDLSIQFRNSGADLLKLTTNKSFIEELVIFFERKKLEWK